MINTTNAVTPIVQTICRRLTGMLGDPVSIPLQVMCHFWGQSGTGAVFLRLLRFPLQILIPSTFIACFAFPRYVVSILVHNRSRDSVVGIATGSELDDRWVGVRVPVGSRIFSSPRRPDRLWGPPNPRG
jgi:hypothetical protein